MPTRSAAIFSRSLLALAALLPACTPADKAPATVPPAPEPPAEWVPVLQEPYGATGRAAVLAEVQRRLVLPFGTPLPAPGSRVVVRFEVGGGMVKNQWIVRGLSHTADSAVLAAVHQLWFNNGPGYYRPSVYYTLEVPAPGAASAAQRREATTRYQRTAVRLPGETDSTFVRRVLPLSTDLLGEYNDELHALAWRPSPYGRQLVFARRALDPTVANGSYGWYDTDLFVLDPYAPGTYAVQQFHLNNIGDLSDQSVTPFVADVNHDGHPDLVTLVTYSQSVSGGEGMPPGHYNYYRVQVWRTAGLDAAGRPRYRQDETPYPYLEYRQDETPGPHPEEFTPATVRRLLARHWRQVARARRPPVPPHPAAPADTTKKAGAASPQESGPGQ
ncbi:MAG: hypothetical protein ACRYFZ_22235 [Janthinobacterium lividum]